MTTSAADYSCYRHGRNVFKVLARQTEKDLIAKVFLACSLAMDTSYKPPLALTVLAGIFLLIGAIFFLIVAIDILWRRGWKSMMWIMYGQLAQI